MNRVFAVFNFVGVLALCVLCGIQWQVNSQVNRRAISLDEIRQQQATKLEENDKTIRAYTSDLEDLRQRLTLSEAQLKQLDEKLSNEVAERNQLAAERDDLKIALGKWMTALAERDKTINQARDELQKLATDRNDAVRKLNDLTDKYNQLVKQWNDQQAKQK
jgi:chromosome segregation ATPase